VPRALPIEARTDTHLEMAAIGAVYLASDRGLFVSRDAGFSWRQAKLPELVMEDLIVTPSAVVVTTPSGLYASRDAGLTWTRVEAPGSDSESSLVRAVGSGAELLAASPTEGLYVAAVTTIAAPVSASRDSEMSEPQK